MALLDLSTVTPGDHISAKSWVSSWCFFAWIVNCTVCKLQIAQPYTITIQVYGVFSGRISL